MLVGQGIVGRRRGVAVLVLQAADGAVEGARELAARVLNGLVQVGRLNDKKKHEAVPIDADLPPESFKNLTDNT